MCGWWEAGSFFSQTKTHTTGGVRGEKVRGAHFQKLASLVFFLSEDLSAAPLQLFHFITVVIIRNVPNNSHHRRARYEAVHPLHQGSLSDSNEDERRGHGEVQEYEDDEESGEEVDEVAVLMTLKDPVGKRPIGKAPDTPPPPKRGRAASSGDDGGSPTPTGKNTAAGSLLPA